MHTCTDYSCCIKDFLKVKDLSHLSHGCSTLEWMFIMCSLRLPLVVNLLPHNSHRTFTFLWTILIWFIRVCFVAKFLSHWPHANLSGFSVCLAFLWAFRWWASLKVWPQKSHSCFRFSVWQFLKCLVWDDFTEKVAGHF